MKVKWNGQGHSISKHATIRIDFSIRLIDIAFVIAYMCDADMKSGEESLSQAESLTRNEIESGIRAYLKEEGVSLFEDTAVFCDDSNYMSQFKDIALKKFPEFQL